MSLGWGSPALGVTWVRLVLIPSVTSLLRFESQVVPRHRSPGRLLHNEVDESSVCTFSVSTSSVDSSIAK